MFSKGCLGLLTVVVVIASTISRLSDPKNLLLHGLSARQVVSSQSLSAAPAEGAGAPPPGAKDGAKDSYKDGAAAAASYGKEQAKDGVKESGKEAGAQDTSGKEGECMSMPPAPGKETPKGSKTAAEEGKATAEGGKVTAEGGKAKAEGGKATAEGGEAKAEGGKATAEGGKAKAEGDKAGAGEEDAKPKKEEPKEAIASSYLSSQPILPLSILVGLSILLA